MAITAPPFRRPTEAAAYRVLHEQGWAAFAEQYPGTAGDLVNDWHDAKIARVRHTADGFTVRTFAKYARP